MKAAVKIYPKSIMPKLFLYRLEPDVDCPFTFVRAFLDQFNPITGELKEEPLAGISLQSIDSKYLNQVFFGKFNAALGIDYLTAFQATQYKGQPEIEYLKHSLEYLYKAVRENNQEAEYWLTEVLFDLKKYQKEFDDRELDLWVDERLWHLQTLLSESQGSLKKQVEQYYQALKTPEESCVVGKKLKRQRSSSSVITQDSAFRPALLPNPRIKASTRKISTVKLTKDSLQDKGVHWLKHSVSPVDRERKRYFGVGLHKYQNLLIQLEVFSAELLRVYIGLRQPRTMISVDEGVYYSLSEYVEKDSLKPHLSDDSGREFLHLGRLLLMNTILDENDGHGGNIIVTPAPENCAVGIDSDRSFWPYAAIFQGSANETKEITIPAAKDAFFDDKYDPQKSRLTRKKRGDPWERHYYLDKTEDHMGKWTAKDYDSFPITQHSMPKNTLFRYPADQARALRLQQDPTFESEKNFMQVKFLCGQWLDALVADTVFEITDDKVRYHVLFDLQRKRAQQIKILKESESFKNFLKQHGNDVAYAIIFEVKLLCKECPEFVDSDEDLKGLLSSIIQNYIALLEEIGVRVPSFLCSNLLDYQQSLRSDILDELRKSVVYLQGRVLKFYQKTGMKLEEAACQQCCEELEARRSELQIAENRTHDYYVEASRLSKKLEKQQRRINGMSVRVDFQLFDQYLNNLKAMLADFDRPQEIDWRCYKKPLKDVEAYLGCAQVAADLAQVYQFAKIYSENNETTFKGLIFKNLLPVIKRQIQTLVAEPSEEAVDNAERTMEFCGFVLSRHRDEKWQNFISLFRSKQQDNVANGPKGFKEWQGLEAVIKSKALKETFDRTVRYNKNTALIFGDNTQTTYSNWASFHQAYKPLLKKESLDTSLISICRVACAA